MIWPAQFAADGYTADLSERFSKEERGEYLPTVIEAMTYEGGIHGVPWYTDTGMLYYRRNLLEESVFSWSHPVSPFYSGMSLRMAAQFVRSLRGDVPSGEVLSTLQDKLGEIVE